MGLAVLFLIAGFVLLYYGAELVVRGASKIAAAIGISPLVIGLTVVAIGTSLPEAFVSIVASAKQSYNICLSNVIGSNIANTGLILGLASFLLPMKINPKLLRREMPVMIAVGILFLIFCADYKIMRWEGAVLTVMFFLFNYWTIRSARKEAKNKPRPPASNNARLSGLFVFIGLCMLTAGGSVLVDGAIRIAEFFSVPEWLIGVTIVAIGTSLPEMATSVIASLKKEGDISVGNIVGSNIFNVLLVIGISALISPLYFTKSSFTLIDLVIMIVFSAGLFPLMKSRYRLTKLEGAALLTGYFAFLAFTIIREL